MASIPSVSSAQPDLKCAIVTLGLMVSIWFFAPIFRRCMPDINSYFLVIIGRYLYVHQGFKHRWVYNSLRTLNMRLTCYEEEYKDYHESIAKE